MKIAYFLDMPRGLGGAGNLLLQTAVLMAELHDVIVVIPSDEVGNSNTEYIRRCDQYNMQYVCLKYSTAYSFTMVDLTGAMKSAELIKNFAEEEKIAFFHSVQLNIAVEYVSRQLGIPHLMSVYSIHEGEFKLCKENIYSQYHLCDSKLFSNIWKDNLQIESRCIRPVAPLDSMKGKDYHPYEVIKVIMVGGLCTYKNQLTAIKAFAKCKDFYGNVELHILGSDTGSYAKECKEYVKKNALEKMILFHGFASDISPYLESGDCLLCASTRESFPLSMIEALTFGLTIISTPVAGVPEIFVDKENAFISRDFSEDAIAESIREYITYHRNGMLGRIHENAVRTWEDNFERGHVGKALDSYYEYIMLNNKMRDTEIYQNLAKEVQEIESLLKCDMEGQQEEQIPKRGLYYRYIKEKLNKGRIYIWGAGKLGKLAYCLLTRLCPDLEIVAFIDMHKDGYINEIPILKLDDIPYDKSYFYAISFSEGRDEAIRFWENKGLTLNRQIWMLP